MIRDVLVTRKCSTRKDFDCARKITNDFLDWLGIDLSFQNIDTELAHFEKMYGGPDGGYILAILGDDVAGGVGIRKVDSEICELKRMFVYQKCRGQGIGIALCETAIELARAMNYRFIRLDTVERLDAANRLYERLGFYDIPAYRFNPDATVRYMEFDLGGPDHLSD